MSGSFKYGPCNIYRSPIWVTLPSDPDVTIQLKPLSHNFITAAQESLYISKSSSDYTLRTTHREIVALSTIDATNSIGFPSVQDVVMQLPQSDIVFLYDRLLDISTVSADQLSELNMMLEVQFSPQFSEDSWNCKVCQSKKLDYARACGFLPEDKRDPKPMLPRVGDRVYTQCPISTIDVHATNQTAMAYNLFDAGVLPEDGGVGEQSEWFVKAALLYKRKIAEAERNAIEAAKNK